MREMEYPFDAAWIISNRRKIKKGLLASNQNYIEKKVAILGGSTTANIVQAMELFLLNNGIKALFYESEYGMYYEDAMFENEKLQDFHPDVIYIHTSNRNVTSLPVLTDTKEEVNALLDSQVQKFTGMCDGISFSC